MSIVTFVTDVIRLAFKSLGERRARALLTIVGISIGPFALVTMISVVSGYSDYVTHQIESLGQNLIVVSPRENFKLTDKDLDFMRSIPGVEDAEPFYMVHAKVRVGSEDKDVTIYATSIDLIFKAISGLKVAEGTTPSPTSVVEALIGHDIAYTSNGRKVHSVGDALTITIFKPKHGEGFEIKRVTVLVSGILSKFGGAFFLSPDTSIYLNKNAGHTILGLNQWSGVLILAKNSKYVPYIVKVLQKAYENNVNIISFQGIAKIVSSIAGAMNFITFSTGLSAFAVAVAGVAATMITSVMERFREIGVMKALGFTDMQVLIMILTEGLIMSILGAVVGISLGVAGAHVLASRGFVIKGAISTIVIKAPPKISADLILRTLSITIAVGLVGSIFPAYKASKIPPAVALRYE